MLYRPRILRCFICPEPKFRLNHALFPSPSNVNNCELVAQLPPYYSFKQFSLNYYMNPFMALKISAAVQYVEFHYSFTFSEIHFIYGSYVEKSQFSLQLSGISSRFYLRVYQ